jgi:hypothetical protein
MEALTECYYDLDGSRFLNDAQDHIRSRDCSESDGCCDAVRMILSEVIDSEQQSGIFSTPQNRG